jgi:SH3-like domain-containing protein
VNRIVTFLRLLARFGAAAAVVLTLGAGTAATAQDDTTAAPATRPGASGLPVPRWVSLKASKVNLRDGPSLDHPVRWVYVREGLPVEIIAEYEVWRRIRDADGTMGWVHKAMLDGRRTVLVRGGDNAALREEPAEAAGIVAYAAPGVIAKLEACAGDWCEVKADNYEGWVRRDRLWGVYPTETVE